MVHTSKPYLWNHEVISLVNDLVSTFMVTLAVLPSPILDLDVMVELNLKLLVSHGMAGQGSVEKTKWARVDSWRRIYQDDQQVRVYIKKRR